jgi:hypothetical protein
MIILRFNEVCIETTCFLSHNEFNQDIPLAFYWNGDILAPVDPIIAIKEGFTISMEDFNLIKEDLLTGGKGFEGPMRPDIDIEPI